MNNVNNNKKLLIELTLIGLFKLAVLPIMILLILSIGVCVYAAYTYIRTNVWDLYLAWDLFKVNYFVAAVFLVSFFVFLKELYFNVRRYYKIKKKNEQ